MLNKDVWLSQYFSGQAYYYAPPFECNEFPKGFIYTKISIEKNKLVNQLMSQGFQLIEVSVLFEQEKIIPLEINSSIKIGFAHPDDEIQVSNLGEESFIFSRFHQDKNIPPELANRIKRDWVTNFFKGQRGDNMIVAYRDSQPVGFMQLLKQTIDLIAVSKQHVCQGIASSMIAFANQHIGLLRAGTQIINKPSVSLYQRCNFVLRNAGFVLHNHVS